MATRYTFPRLFELEMASAIGARDKRTSASHYARALDKLTGGDFKMPQEWIAVALRWRLSPFLGIPLMPFNVFRRTTDSKKYSRMGISKRSIHGNTLSLNSKLYYEFTFFANNKYLNQATISALDDNREPILGEVVTINAGEAKTVRFKAPNIAYIKVHNSVEVNSFSGITMGEMVNLNDWELFERAGLPYKKGQVPNNVYNTTIMQGRAGHPLEGDEACKFRVDLARMFYSPPPTSDAGISIPSINAPKGEEVLLEISDGSDSLLKLLTEMFEVTSQTSFSKRQVDHLALVKGTGMHQNGTGVTTDDTEFEIPLAGTTMLSASMDMWASLGLGFGVTDIVDHNKFQQTKYLEPIRSFRSPYDYMVTSRFGLPGGTKIEIAALSRFNRFPDVGQTPLSVSEFSENRPFNKDQHFSEDLELKWLRVPAKILPVSYIFARSDDGVNAKILSEKRPFTSKSYYGFVPAVNPEQDATHQLMASYISQLNNVPFSGSRTLTYFKVATDVFGRWSEWVNKTHTLSARQPHMPTVLKVDFNLASSPFVGKKFKSSLFFEIAWDWEDRSPKFIEIAGKFIDPTIDPGIVAPGGFQMDSNNAALSPTIKIEFNSTNLNHSPVANTPDVVVTKMPHTTEDGKNRKYSVEVKNVNVNFALKNRHSFVAYAKASEKVNPLTFSGYSPFKKGTTNNPLPAAPIAMGGPPINWTALPDATGYARYHLSFSPDPSTDVIGFIIYEATELALRDAIGLPTLNTTDISTRALDLLNNQADVKTKDAFIRKNKDLLDSPEVTVNLPAVASGLYAYCVSSMTSEQVESEKSDWVLVAVPHRTTPAPPILSAKNTEAGIQLCVEPYGAIPSKTIELYRTRSKLLVTDINVMGKPVAYDNDPRWEKLDENDVLIVSPNQLAATYKLVDAAKSSWLPYYYRAAAFGNHEPNDGIIKGRSKSSNLIKITSIPKDPPDLLSLTVSKSGADLKISVRSSAERWNSPLGAHQLKILTIDRTAITFEEVEHINASLPSIQEKTSPGSTPLEFRRSSLDANGRWLYEAYIPMTEHEVIVRIIDPKYRQTELRTTYVAPPAPMKLDLISLLAKRNSKRLLVTFKSSVSIIKPKRGGYKLEIFESNGTSSVLLLQKNIHEIPATKSTSSTSAIGGLGGSITIRDPRVLQPLRPDLTTPGSRPITSLTLSKITRSIKKDSKGRYTYTATIPNKTRLVISSRLKHKVIVKITVNRFKMVQKEKVITKG